VRTDGVPAAARPTRGMRAGGRCVPLFDADDSRIAGNMIQPRLVWSGESFKRNQQRCTPGAGFKRVFGKQAVGELPPRVVKLIASAPS